MAEAVPVIPKPEGYSPPDWEHVAALLEELRRQRQPVIDRIWAVKRARRGQWEDVVRRIPKSFRSMMLDPDLPMIRDMIQRITGLVSKSPPLWQVSPASIRQPEVSRAAAEEKRIAATWLAIEDQQDRPIYSMLADAQAAWGESWLAIFPDPSRWKKPEYERGQDESADEYEERYKTLMLRGGIPIQFMDFDPQAVFPLRADNGRIPLVIVETEHVEYDINLGLGYRAERDEYGKVRSWQKSTFSEPYVLSSARQDTGSAGATGRSSSTVKKTIYFDCWVAITYLDGIEVERWEHNWGFVPLIPAAGEQSSDRDPGWESAGVADAGLAIARQMVMYAAVMSSNAMQHGFPTPFLKNPIHGLVMPNGEPITRSVQLGEMNLLGPNEEIIFPYLQAGMMPDFFRHMEWLMEQLESTTISNFGKAIGSDIAGYAIAQIRAMQLSVLVTIYTNLARQLRKAGYMIRHIIRTEFPAGIYLPGAVEEDEASGVQYRPIMKFAPEHTTDNPINVILAEGIPQDEMAMNKMALENLQAGIWSRRRVMEKTGVEDPAAEEMEIDQHRLLNSPAADQQVWILAMAMAAQRFQATEEQRASPFMQALVQAKNKLLGVDQQAPGQPGPEPDNALPGGQPIQQNPPVPVPQQGGPTAGPNPPPLTAFGIPGIPGGVQQIRPRP